MAGLEVLVDDEPLDDFPPLVDEEALHDVPTFLLADEEPIDDVPYLLADEEPIAQLLDHEVPHLLLK